MAYQVSFASLDFAAKKKRTKRDVFLAEMAVVVPWGKLQALNREFYVGRVISPVRRRFALALSRHRIIRVV